MGAPKVTTSVGRAQSGMLAVLYDGSCEMCQASVEGVRRFDNSGVIQALDLNDADVRVHFPELTRERLLEELHAVDDQGRVYRGARAINEILRRQRGWKGWVAYMWYFPGFAWAADRQYKRIAATRYERDPRGRLKNPAAS